MKVIVQVPYGSPDGLELREIEKPALAGDRVLVRVRATNSATGMRGIANTRAKRPRSHSR